MTTCRLRASADFAQDKLRRLIERWEQLDDVAKRGTISAIYHALDRGNPRHESACTPAPDAAHSTARSGGYHGNSPAIVARAHSSFGVSAMKRDLEVGDVVIFHDSLNRAHNALITAVHGEPQEGYVPCVNLVFVSGDGDRTDGYGRQIERHTSLVHRDQQSAAGMYFRFRDELPRERAPAAT